MKYFTKKQSCVFMTLSFILLAAGTVLVCISGSFKDLFYSFLSQKMFHREFHIDKWLPTMNSIFAAPAFISVVATALFFPKFEGRDRTVILSMFFISVMVVTFYCTATRSVCLVDSDLASEILLAKECLREKSLWPRGWNYSTEIRILNTQLVTAPAFLFTDSWNTAKLVTSIVSVILLFLSVYYLMVQMQIREFWLRYLVCIMTVLPFSGTAWYVGAWGTYYIPHAVFTMLYLGFFIRLTRSDASGHPKLLTALFYAAAFIAGLSSIRYILLFVFPLALISVIDGCLKKDPECKISDFKKFWLGIKSVRLSVTAMIAAGLGYVCNSLILRHLFSFSDWNTEAFCTLGDITLIDAMHCILSIFGYRDNIAVVTPNGLLNILIYVFLLTFVLLMFSVRRTQMPEGHRLMLRFFVTAFLFNTFVYVHTGLIERYYWPTLILIFPCTAVLIQNGSISGLKKYALGTMLSVIVFAASFSTVQEYLQTDYNASRYEVCDFLRKNYGFGYATFWNANVTSYITNGEVEVGVPGRRWLTPERYYGSAHDGESVFLLMTQGEYGTEFSKSVIEAGTKVYEDASFIVLEYPSHAALKQVLN